MPVFGVLQAGKSTYGGQPVWYGDPDNPQPFTISNLSVTATIYTGTSQSVDPNNPNESTPISPGGYLSFDGTEHVYYAIANGPNALAVTYPGVTSIFQTTAIATPSPSTLTEDPSSPAPVDIQPVNGPVATTAAFSPPANTLLVAMVTVIDNASTFATIAVSDSGSHTWSLIPNVAQSNYAAGIFIAYLTTAPGSITVTAKNTNAAVGTGLSLTVKVLNGANPNQSSAGFATANDGGVATVNIRGTITTTQVGSLVYVTAATVNGSTYTALISTKELHRFADTSIGEYLSGESANTTAIPGTSTFGWTAGAAESFSIAMLEVLHS